MNAGVEQLGVPFVATIQRAEQLAEGVIRDKGAFRITCLGGTLIGRN
ncbi:hypothetical protein [Streptomyces agglomeratus]|nr:hypothetical protein [Streptomyces agglomeratus]